MSIKPGDGLWTCPWFYTLRNLKVEDARYVYVLKICTVFSGRNNNNLGVYTLHNHTGLGYFLIFPCAVHY